METDNIPGGTLRISLANISQKIILALFYMILTKTNALTQTDIGILSVLSFIAAAFPLLTQLSLPTALTKFTSEKLGKNQQEEAAAVQKTITKIVVTLSLAGLVIVTLSSQLLSEYFWNKPEYAFLIVMMIVYAFVSNILALCGSTLQALHLFGKMATLTITFIFSSRIIALTLALLHLGVAGVVIGHVIGSIITVAIAVGFLRGKLPKTSKNTPLKPLLHFSLPLVLGAISALVLNWADVMLMATLTTDYASTGIYYIVIRSVGTLAILWTPMMTTIFPAISARNGLENPKSISSILRTTSRYLIYIILPSCLGLAIIAPTALTFFYGPGYADGAIPLTILSIATIIIALYSLFATTLTAIGKTGQILKINIVSALSTVLLLIALVPFFETIGAAFARLTTQIIGLLLAIYILHKEIRIQLDRDALWKAAVASAATVPFLVFFELFISTRLPTTQTLIIEILTAAGIYVLFLYILRALKRQDFDLLRQAFPTPLAKYINILEGIMVRKPPTSSMRVRNEE